MLHLYSDILDLRVIGGILQPNPVFSQSTGLITTQNIRFGRGQGLGQVLERILQGLDTRRVYEYVT